MKKLRANRPIKYGPNGETAQPGEVFSFDEVAYPESFASLTTRQVRTALDNMTITAEEPPAATEVIE